MLNDELGKGDLTAHVEEVREDSPPDTAVADADERVLPGFIPFVCCQRRLWDRELGHGTSEVDYASEDNSVCQYDIGDAAVEGDDRAEGVTGAGSGGWEETSAWVQGVQCWRLVRGRSIEDKGVGYGRSQYRSDACEGLSHQDPEGS